MGFPGWSLGTRWWRSARSAKNAFYKVELRSIRNNGNQNLAFCAAEIVMHFNFDPARWLVSFVGFLVDWFMTREWAKIGLSSIPLMFLTTTAGLVFCGSRLDKHQLAARYLELGEKEIADWEDSWAPDKSANALTDSSRDTAITATSEATAVSAVKSDAASKAEKKELSRFAEVLFRRVQLLEPNEHSQFVIGVTMAQRGATGQAQRIFSKIAPDNRPGYSPAHAWIAQNLLRQPITDENVKLVMHHVTEAVKWDRVPESILLIGSELLLRLGDQAGCLKLLKRAAAVNPANNLLLFQRSKQLQNKVLAEQSAAQAEAYFRGRVERDPSDLKARFGLVQILAENAKLAEAEQVIRAGMQLEPAPELTRGLSEVYRLLYLTSLKQDGVTWTGDLQMLDKAMRTDPANPMVAEEIAKLARLNGKSPGDELIHKLQQFLAEGKATAATHAWIAELYLIRGSYSQAMPHLEQVVTRLPNAPQYLNNLAYVIDQIAPDRRQEALTLAQRAVQLDPSAADYYDTLAKILAGLNRRTEAIAALESAIERQPKRKDFHEGIAALYEANGNPPMAEQHREMVKRIRAYEEQLAAQTAAAADKANPSEGNTLAPSQPEPSVTEPSASESTGPELKPE